MTQRKGHEVCDVDRDPIFVSVWGQCQYYHLVLWVWGQCQYYHLVLTALLVRWTLLAFLNGWGILPTEASQYPDDAGNPITSSDVPTSQELGAEGIKNSCQWLRSHLEGLST